MKLILTLWCHKIIRILKFRRQESDFSQDESCGHVTSREWRFHCLNHPLHPVSLNGSPILLKHWAQSSGPSAGSKYTARNVWRRPFINYVSVAAVLRISVGTWQVSSSSHAYSWFSQKEIFILVKWLKWEFAFRIEARGVCFEHNIEEFVALRTTVSLLKDLSVFAVVNCGKWVSLNVR
jgi:hypothetical protein